MTEKGCLRTVQSETDTIDDLRPVRHPFVRQSLALAVAIIVLTLPAGIVLSGFGSIYLDVFSANVSVCALAVALIMQLRWRDWRLLPLVLLFAALACQQTLYVIAELRGGPLCPADGWLLEHPWFVPTALGLAAILSSWHLFGAREEIARREEQLSQRLQQGQKIESLGVMASGVAHKFNNYLTAIIGNATLAKLDAPAGSEQMHALEALEQEAEKAARISMQMLDYSGHGKFSVELVCLAQLIGDMKELLDACLRNAGRIEYDIHEGGHIVSGDTAQLGQVAMNLVGNAAEGLGTGDGLVTVRIETRQIGADELVDFIATPPLNPGEYVSLCVSDTGGGIPADMQPLVFDPFVSTKSLGRGLGLAAVLGIVRGHHGGVRLESSPNIGTTVEVLLPSEKTAKTVPDTTPKQENPS
ncbi:MAG: hypothetical protein KAI66_09485 [Lentisphaeria bacterium]|nr:hypothetical protein [Lentisphaeria bacterium]